MKAKAKARLPVPGHPVVFQHGIGFRSLQESIDTTSPAGKLFFHVIGALAEFERDLIRERTQAGLASARARGRMGGRPKKMDAKKGEMARSLYAAKNSVKDICETLGISKATLYRHLPSQNATRVESLT
jgi:DNA invertase Pin-like site-specific DNA recombinase